MDNELAVFIMVHGRPDKMWTANTLRKSGYTGKIFYVADDLDETVEKYRDKYGDDLIVFSKAEMANDVDAGDNSGDLRSTLYPATKIFDLAREKGFKYFFIMCDDYTDFSYRFDENFDYNYSKVNNLDEIFKAMVKFYASTDILTLAFAQGGDFIGGSKSKRADKPNLLRKAMNTFLCSTDRPFKFMGRLNEDVTTYTRLGSVGKLFMTLTNISIGQKEHQSEKEGLTEVYLDNGTYVKSFFSLMYNPSCIKVGTMSSRYKRIHHKVIWNHAVPKIISEDVKIKIT